MDINIGLGLAGIVATIVLGAWAIYLAFLYSRQVDIAFIEDQCIALTDDITRGIGELQIRFRDQPVSENLVLLKGFIVNSGKRDIEPTMVEQQLRLTLPDGFQWMDCQIREHSPNLRAAVNTVSRDAIQFEIGLFKKREFFRFDALATVPSEENLPAHKRKASPALLLRSSIDFDHRITDADTIRKLRLYELQSPAPLHSLVGRSRQRGPMSLFAPAVSWAMTSIWLPLLMIIVSAGMLAAFKYFAPMRVAYKVADSANQKVVVFPRVKGEQILLRNADGATIHSVTPHEFDALQKMTLLGPEDSRPILIMASTYAAFGLILLAIWLLRSLRIRKYRWIVRLADK